MSVHLSLIGNAFQFFNANGRPLSLGSLYTFAAGTSTPQTTYTDSAGSVPNANPIVLDASGRLANEVWLTDGQAYKFVLKDAGGSTIGTYDNITGIGDPNLANLLAASSGSSLVGYIEGDSGSVARTVQARLRDFINLKDFGAVGNGITDDTAAVQAALAIANGKVIFAPDTYLISSKITLPAFSVHFIGLGTGTFKTNGTNILFEKTQHDQLVSFVGCKFQGGGTALNFAMTPTTSTFYDYYIRDCRFTMNAGVYGISLVGCREGFIQNCSFYGPGNGLYMQSSVSPFVCECLFIGTAQSGTAVFYDGAGDAESAGLVLQNCEILGWDIGVEIEYCDWFDITGCTIDYNNHSVQILSQDEGNLHHNFIGSFGNNPAILLGQGVKGLTPDFNTNIIIHGNNIVGHVLVGNLYDCIQMTGANSQIGITITDNQINFWTRYGISFAAIQTMIVQGNVFAPKAGLGTHTIFNTLGNGDSGLIIAQNVIPAAFPLSGSGLSFCQIRDNQGFTTRRTGAFVTDGVSTSFTIAHGCDTTPTSVLLTASAGAARPLWYTAVDGTNITAHTDGVYAAFTIAWQAERWVGA